MLSKLTENSKVLQRTQLVALQTSTRERISWLTELLNQGDKEIYNGPMLPTKQDEGIITTIIINNRGVLHSKVKDVLLEESENILKLTKK